MTDDKTRRDILLYIRDHPGTDKWDLFESVPCSNKTTFYTLKDLRKEGLIRLDVIRTETEDPHVHNVRFTLHLTAEGMEAVA